MLLVLLVFICVIVVWFILLLWLLTSIALLGITMLCLRQPIPHHFSQPWRLRAFLLAIKLGLEIGWVLEKLGMLSMIYVTNQMVRIITHMDPRQRKGRAVDTLFDGVKVRLYKPRMVSKEDPGGYPALIYFHGGGWALGNTRIYDDVMIPISNGLDIMIVSVEYRMSPKHKFPVPLEDCVTATKYFLENCAEFSVNPERVAIGGDSAGGNLAAATALRLRDEQFTPSPKLQVLIYPVLQALDYGLPSMVQNGNGPLLTRYWLAYYTCLYATGSLKHVRAIMRNMHTTPEIKKQLYSTYINHDLLDPEFRYHPYTKPDFEKGNKVVWNQLKDTLLNPYFSPLVADDLSRLPETLIYTPRYDILRDEGILYGRRLQAAGVPVTHIHGGNTLHGICSFRHIFPKEANQSISSIMEFLKAKL